MEYQALLERFRSGPDELERAVKGVTKELAGYRPFPEAWSIRELVVHITDSEINNFIRWKSIIAQPRSNAFVVEEEAWVRNMKYTTANIEKYLMVFRLLREISYEYLIELDEKEWNNEYFLHPTLGRVTLEKCISMYANHIPSHIEHIERNKKHWAARG